MEQKVSLDNKISYIGSLKINKGETYFTLTDISHLFKPLQNNFNIKEDKQKNKCSNKYQYSLKTHENNNDLKANNNTTSSNYNNSECLYLLNSGSFSFSKSKSLSIHNLYTSNQLNKFEPYKLKVDKKTLTDKHEINIDLSLSEPDNDLKFINVESCNSLNINQVNNSSKNVTENLNLSLNNEKLVNNELNNNDKYYPINSLNKNVNNNNQVNDVEILNSNNSIKYNNHNTWDKVIFCDNQNLKNDIKLTDDINKRLNKIESDNTNCDRLLNNYTENINCKKSNNILINNINNKNETPVSGVYSCNKISQKSSVDQSVIYLGSQKSNLTPKKLNNFFNNNYNASFETIKRKSDNLISDLPNKIQKSNIWKYSYFTFTVPDSRSKSIKYKLEENILINDSLKKDTHLNACARSMSYKGRFKYFNPSSSLKNRSSTSLMPSQRRGFLYKYPRIEYQRMKSMKKICIQIKPSLIHGMGLFAMRDFENGEMLIEYTGEIIRWTVANKREIQYEALKKGCYMFQLDDNRIIDATHTGGIARYINHSCKPNCDSRVLSIDGVLKIVILTIANIRRGEELTYNYKFHKEDVKIICQCRANKCKGYLN